MILVVWFCCEHSAMIHHFCRFWDDFGAILASFWSQKSVLGGLGRVFGALGVVLGARGGTWGRFLSILGRFWDRFRDVFGYKICDFGDCF